MAMIEFDHVSKKFGDGFVAVDDLSLRIEDGEFMIFVGPSGCGKTTALRMIAGLEDVSSGEIRIGGRSVGGLDPQDRDVAMVFQNYALYPHKSVRENIGFPLRMRSMAKAEIDARVLEVAKMLGIEALLVRKPRDLSGGQRQRVAMGRAIIRHPRAFLMDEPLSNLDAKLRIQMRVELVRLHRRLGVTTIYVTHDQTEAMTLGQRVTVLNKGRIQQVAPPHHLYMHPANAFVAGFIGSPPMNFLRGRMTESGVDIGPVQVVLDPETRRRITGGSPDVLVGLRPEGLVPTTKVDEAIVGEVEVVEELGAERYLYLRPRGLDVVEQSERPAELAGSICARLTESIGIAAGGTVALRPRPELVRLFDLNTGASRLTVPESC
jgi:multiple sugar transport system ATP-binding protein